jgi:hypothetical protein
VVGEKLNSGFGGLPFGNVGGNATQADQLACRIAEWSAMGFDPAYRSVCPPDAAFKMPFGFGLDRGLKGRRHPITIFGQNLAEKSVISPIGRGLVIAEDLVDTARVRRFAGGQVQFPTAESTGIEGKAQISLHARAGFGFETQVADCRFQFGGSPDNSILEFGGFALQLRVSPSQLGPHRRHCQMGVNPRQYFRRLERLGDIIDATGREAGDLAVAVGQGGREDHWDVAGGFSRLQPPTGGEAVQARHHHIQQNQVGADEFRPPHPLFPILRHQYAVAVGFQAIDHHPQIGGVVIDDQDGRRRAGGDRSVRYRCLLIWCFSRTRESAEAHSGLAPLGVTILELGRMRPSTSICPSAAVTMMGMSRVGATAFSRRQALKPSTPGMLTSN